MTREGTEVTHEYAEFGTAAHVYRSEPKEHIRPTKPFNRTELAWCVTRNHLTRSGIMLTDRTWFRNEHHARIWAELTNITL